MKPDLKLVVLILSFNLLLIFSVFSQIQPTNGPEGGRILCIEKNSHSIFASTLNGVYRSDDTGRTWQSINNGIEKDLIQSMVTIGDIIFASSNNPYHTPIYRSLDNGNSWKKLPNTIPDLEDYVDFDASSNKFLPGPFQKLDVEKLVVVHDTVFALARQQVYCMGAKDSTWRDSFLRFPPNPGKLIQAEKLICVTGDFPPEPAAKVFDDTARLWINWKPIGVLGKVLNILQSESYLMLITQDSLSKYKFYLSNDNGLTFQLTKGLDAIFKKITSLVFINGELILGGYNLSDRLKLVYSADLGKNWRPLAFQIPEMDDNTSRLMLFSKTLLLSNDNGVFRSEDFGRSWRFSTFGMNCVTISSLFSNTDAVFTKSPQSLWKLCGNHWKVILNDSFSSAFTHAILSGRTLFALIGKKAFRSPDYGLTWQKLNGFFGENASVNSVVVDSNRIYLGVDNQGIYVSNSRGISWERLPNLPKGADLIFRDSADIILIGLHNQISFNIWFRNASFQENAQLFKPDRFFARFHPFTQQKQVKLLSLNSSFSLLDIHFQAPISGGMILAGYMGVYVFDLKTKNICPITKGLTKEYNSARSDSAYGVYELISFKKHVFLQNHDGVFRYNCVDSSWLPLNKGLMKADSDQSYFHVENGDLCLTFNSSRWFLSQDLSAWEKPVLNDAMLHPLTRPLNHPLGTINSEKKTTFLANELRIVSTVEKSGILFAGTFGNGLFKSYDKGNTWMSIPSNDESFYYKALYIAGNNILRLTSGNNPISHYRGYQLSISTNDGKSWVPIEFMRLNQNYFIDEPIDLFKSGNQVYIKTLQGFIYFSNDFGFTWEKFEGKAMGLFKDFVLNNELVVGLTESGVFVSPDSGNHWDCAAGLPLNEPIYIIAKRDKQILLISQNHVFANTVGNNWKSSDSYNVKYFLDTNDFSRGGTNNVFQLGDTNWNLNFGGVSKVDSTNQYCFALSTQGELFKKGVKDISWKKMFCTLNQPVVSFVSDSTNQYLLNQDGLWVKTKKCAQWILGPDSFDYSHTTSLVTTDHFLFMVSENKLYKSSGNKLDWFLLKNLPTNLHVGFFENIQNQLYLGTEQGIYNSKDEGETWTKWASLNCWPFGELYCFNNRFYLQTASGFGFCSSDFGTKWNFINPIDSNLKGPISNDTYEPLTYYIDASTGERKILDKSALVKPLVGLPESSYRSTCFTSSFYKCGKKYYVGLETPESHVATFCSVDARKWEMVDNGLPMNANITSIVKSKGRFLATTTFGVYQSTNNGQNWTKLICSEMSEFFIHKFLRKGKTLFALASQSNEDLMRQRKRLFKSVNGGKNWSPVCQELSKLRVLNIQVCKKNLIVRIEDTCYLNPSLPLMQCYLISSDEGVHWKPMDGFPDHENQFNSFMQYENHLFCLEYRYGFRSDDAGLHWKKLEFIPEGASSFQLEGSRLWAYCSGHSSYFSDNLGEIWHKYFPNMGSNSRAKNDLSDFKIPGFLEQVQCNGSLVVLKSKGKDNYPYSDYSIFRLSFENGHWHKSDTLLKGEGYPTLIANDRDVFCYDSKIYGSHDNGINWAEIKFPIDTSNYWNDKWQLVRIENDWIAYAKTKVSVADFVQGEYVYFRSSDGGKTWTSPQRGPNSGLNELKIFGNHLFGYNGCHYFSGDAGRTWLGLCPNLSSPSILTNLIKGNSKFALTQDGFVFRSDDGGHNWIVLNFNSTQDKIQHIFEAGDYICFTGFNSRGDFKFYTLSLPTNHLSEVKGFPNLTYGVDIKYEYQTSSKTLFISPQNNSVLKLQF